MKTFFQEWFTNVEDGILLSSGRLLFVTDYTNIDHGGSSIGMRLLDIKTEKQVYNFEITSYPFKPLAIDEHTFISMNGCSIQIWNY